VLLKVLLAPGARDPGPSGQGGPSAGIKVHTPGAFLGVRDDTGLVTKPFPDDMLSKC